MIKFSTSGFYWEKFGGKNHPNRSWLNINKMQKKPGQYVVGASFAHPWFRVLPRRPKSPTSSSKNGFTFSKLSFS
jgi:hypothetical protein